MKSVQVFIEEEDTTGVCELAVSKRFTRKLCTSAPRKAGQPADKRDLPDTGQGSVVKGRTVGCLGRKSRPDPTKVKSPCGDTQVTETSSDQGGTSWEPQWEAAAPHAGLAKRCPRLDTAAFLVK